MSMMVRGLLPYATSLQMEINGACRLCLFCGRDPCIRIALTPVSTASVSCPVLCVVLFMHNVLGYCAIQVVVLHGLLLLNLGENEQSSKLCAQLLQDVWPCARKRGHCRSTPCA